MEQEYRYSVEVLSDVGFNTYESSIIHQTNCRESADDVASQNNGSVVDHHISEKDMLMELNSWFIRNLYKELNWYVSELVKATEDINTPHHHITYLSDKIERKTTEITKSIQVIQKTSQRKADLK